MRSTDEMFDAFNFLSKEKAFEIIVENTNKIADMIEPLRPIHDKPFPPHIENCDELLKDRVYKKAHALYGNPLPELIE